jgi:hypothetical protein
VLFVLAVVPASLAVAQTPPAPGPLTPDEWRADLKTFAEEFPRVHKNLFHTMTREEFDGAVRRLDERIPSMKDHEVVIELMRIAAMVGDGHTKIGGVLQWFRSGRYPLELYRFSDGLFIRRISAEQADLAGAKLLRLGSVTADEAIRRVSGIISRDNEMGVWEDAPFFLAIPEVLEALEIADGLDSLAMEVEVDGKPRSVRLSPVRERPEKIVDARDGAPGPDPLWLRHPDDPLWYEYLPDRKTLYVNCDQILDGKDESLEAFFARVLSFAAANPVERLVLDLRMNGGGNNYLTRFILRDVIKSGLDEPGRFFAIIGRGTFSAAGNLVNRLEQYTNVIFVGEPTGARPNSYGDARSRTLPNSGLAARASTLWWQDLDPRDDRVWTEPRVAAGLTAADYRANRDPAMEAVLEYAAAPTIDEIARAAAEATSIDGFLESYRSFKQDPKNAWALTERAVNTLGYRLMEAQRLDDAVKVLTLNTEAYPESANAFDSLGEALARRGDREGAIKCYERAVSLHPGMRSSIEALQRHRTR